MLTMQLHLSPGRNDLGSLPVTCWVTRLCPGAALKSGGSFGEPPGAFDDGRGGLLLAGSSPSKKPAATQKSRHCGLARHTPILSA